jgi:serine/threonine-protein kinase
MSSTDPNATGPGTPSAPTVAEDDRPRRRNGWLWLAAILGLIVIALSAYIIYRFLTDEPPTSPGAVISVPNLVGRTLDDARVIADAVGLELSPTGRVSDRPISTVLTQDPGAGALVAQGSSVAVTIATGTDTVTIPDLLGLPEADAIGLLVQVGLTAGVRIEAFDTVVVAGAIAGQEPQPGSEAARGTPVSYVVSRGPVSSASGGPSPGATPLPSRTAPPIGGTLEVGDYGCLTLADATRRLQGDGFTLGSVTYTFEGGPVDDTWLVDRQTPTPGERWPPGTAVDLVLSSPFMVCPGSS